MRKQSIVVHATGICALVLALSTAAMAADPHVGTWKQNVAKSKLNGPADKSSTIKIDAQDNGIMLVDDGIGSDGKAFHAAFAAKYDGKDYPITGDPDVDTVSLKKIDEDTWAEVLKKAGKEVLSGRVTVSKDGKTMTRTVKGKLTNGKDINNTYVFDKQ